MLGWFAETTLVALVVAGVAALAGRFRPIGPTARHVLWLAVLVKLLTPSLICWPWAVPWRDLAWPMHSPRVELVCDSCVAEPVEDDPAPPSPLLRAAAIKVAMADLLEAPASPDCLPSPDRPATAGVSAAELERGLIIAWLVLTGLLAGVQAWRILRFRRRLGAAVPAPDDLVAEAGRIAGQLGGRAPELLVVPGLGTPMLWCLGRPKILLPAPLVKALDNDRWRGILAHELAHLRRGDHWVSRLELVAGLFWWWNPLYWLTRARLDAEAELACDAWVVGALPEDRLAYAETLFHIGSALSRTVSPAPALGAAGSGRFLERRLTMILHERVPFRLSPLALLAAGLLVLFALPSWSATVVPTIDPAERPAPATLDPPAVSASIAAPALDDDDDDDPEVARAKEALAKAEAKAKAKAEAKAKAKAKVEAQAKAKKSDSDVAARIEKEVEAKFGPGSEFEKKMEALGKEMEAKFGSGSEFEKKMEAFGEALGKEMETKFGPEFEKKMEALGKEMEAKFGSGSEFEKQMKELGKELGAKLGPGSEFEKQMKELGKELGTKLGPGSEFEKQMKELGKDLGAKLGPGSEFEKQMKELGEKIKQKAEAGSAKKASADEKEKPKVATTKARREARIAALEATIRKLAEELKALEDEKDEDR
jgi:beta-lactamase regulating signal transducer with metallopeptidase domain